MSHFGITPAFTVLLLAANSVSVQQKRPATQLPSSVPDPIPLEIKGDHIGESFEDFKTHYPKAECNDESREVRVCSQKADISLANHHVTPCPQSPPKSGVEIFLMNVCMYEGLIAGFHKNSLNPLSYTFRTLDETEDLARTCAAFQAKYGSPDLKSDTECSWYWKNRGGEIEQELSIKVWKQRLPYIEQSGEVEFKQVSFLEVVLRNTRPSKDI
jgi:hypothetical protein